MPRITSLNILLESDGKDYLSELYGKVIEGVQKALISGSMKNMDLSGDPVSGTVEAKRFVNATSKTYGTARAAGKGDAVKAKHRQGNRRGAGREGCPPVWRGRRSGSSFCKPHPAHGCRAGQRLLRGCG